MTLSGDCKQPSLSDEEIGAPEKLPVTFPASGRSRGGAPVVGASIRNLQRTELAFMSGFSHLSSVTFKYSFKDIYFPLENFPELCGMHFKNIFMMNYILNYPEQLLLMNFLFTKWRDEEIVKLHLV